MIVAARLISDGLMTIESSINSAVVFIYDLREPK
jgi:hypothetical protein